MDTFTSGPLTSATTFGRWTARVHLDVFAATIRDLRSTSVNKMTPATKQSNYRLSPECRALLAAIARHYAAELNLPNFTATAVIEMCVREKAKAIGVSPKTAKSSR